MTAGGPVKSTNVLKHWRTLVRASGISNYDITTTNLRKLRPWGVPVVQSNYYSGEEPNSSI